MKNNWILEFNKVERKAYEMNYELGERLEKIYNEGYGREFYKMCEDVLVETKYNNKKFDSIDEKCLYLISEYNKIAVMRKEENKFNKILDWFKQEMITLDSDIDDMIINNVLKKCFNVDRNRFFNRKKLLDARLRKQLDSYIKLFLGAINSAEQDVIKELNEYVIYFTNKYENRKLDELRELENITIDKFQYRKIFDYKDMCKHAKENGFKHKRTTGDHMMFEHKKTKEVLPIPAHELGYGLMREIQKEIKEKSAA